jgi:hypothetical protein
VTDSELIDLVVRALRAVQENEGDSAVALAAETMICANATILADQFGAGVMIDALTAAGLAAGKVSNEQAPALRTAVALPS